jgi:hypothetical protein
MLAAIVPAAVGAQLPLLTAYGPRGSAMKIRTFLIFVCMIVVPLLAMFSHKVPPEIRTACGNLLMRPALALIEAAAHSTETKPEASPVDFAAPPAGPLLAGGPPPGPSGEAQPAGLHEGKEAPSQVGATPVALRTGSPSPHPQPQSARATESLSPASLMPPSSPAADQLHSDRLRRQMAAAGVHRILLEPSTDGSGNFHGSCRVAVDPKGELQRLFHAQASSKDKTLQNLFEQVTRWQQRLAATLPESKPPQGVLR